MYVETICQGCWKFACFISVEDRKEKKKKFDICRGSDIKMDYGLQEFSEQMRIIVTSRIPSFTLQKAEDRT